MDCGTTLIKQDEGYYNIFYKCPECKKEYQLVKESNRMIRRGE